MTDYKLHGYVQLCYEETSIGSSEGQSVPGAVSGQHRTLMPSTKPSSSWWEYPEVRYNINIINGLLSFTLARNDTVNEGLF